MRVIGGLIAAIVCLGATVAAPALAAAPAPVYADFGPPGRVIEQTRIADLDVTLVRFANGMRLAVKQTEPETDDVEIRVSVSGGRSAIVGADLLAERATVLWAANGGVTRGAGIPPIPVQRTAGLFLLGGLRSLDFETIWESSARDLEHLGFSVDDDAFRFRARASAESFDRQLQLLAAYLLAPGWRTTHFDEVKTQYARDGSLNARQLVGGPPFGNAVAGLLHNNQHPWTTPNVFEILAMRPSDVRLTLEPLLARGSVAVAVAGGVSVPEVITAVAATFGTLPARREIIWPVPKIPFFPQTPSPVTYSYNGWAPGTVVAAWPIPYRATDRIEGWIINAISQIVSDRMRRVPEFNPITGGQSATRGGAFAYGPFGYFATYAPITPERRDLYFQSIAKIASDLRAVAVSERELDVARRRQADAIFGNATWADNLLMAQANPAYWDRLRADVSGYPEITAQDIRRVAQKYLTDAELRKIVLAAEPAR
jgi:zinc protease